jgi:ubiquinone/menaquinone biosynthesis C-methylase UbiE
VAARRSRRINYDRIAPGYDQQPLRQKQVDPHLLAFINERFVGSKRDLSILDLGCGTGSQLIVNQPHLPTARMVGLDLSGGMVHQARFKMAELNWIQANSQQPPFAAASFDYISNQFSFHHVLDKRSMFQSIYRLLRPGGRAVVTNILPHEMADWLYYRYFPKALAADLQDFPPLEMLVDLTTEAGFSRVVIDLDHYVTTEDLRQFAEGTQQRHHCSQLLVISKADYEAGLAQLKSDLAQADPGLVPVQNEICLMTLYADKV